MLLNHMFLGLLWIVYCVLHSVLASIHVKTRIKQGMGKQYKFYRFYYTIFSLVFLIAMIWLLIGISSVLLFNPALFLKIIGGIISGAGLFLMLICIKRYFMSVSGLKNLLQKNTSNELVIAGVHRYVRHPLYLGTFIFLWGLLLVCPYLSWLITITIITIYTVIAIKFEEEKLILEFGEQYKIYKEKVPKLFPRLPFTE